MTTKGNSCTVTVEIDQAACSQAFLSDAMRTVLEEKSKTMAEQKTQGAKAHLHGPMPNKGLFSYRMKRGRKTWIGVIYPASRAAYNIGRKYGTENL